MSLKTNINNNLKCDSVNRPHSILSRAVCLSLHPGRLIIFPFLKWFDKRYRGKYKFEKTIFSIDLVLVGSAVTLALIATTLVIFPYKKFEDRILFNATVAPHEITTGAPSTLVIRYTNGTKEVLRQTKLNLIFPDHFLLQSVFANESNVEKDQINLGDIPVGGTGAVHVNGVMFGDVQGKQTFESVMQFVHGIKNDHFGIKHSTYTFSPEHSALQLSVKLPDRVIASQPLSGMITYKNTGPIDFPEIIIEPEWPKKFILKAASAQIKNNAFVLPKIKAGASGNVTFNGFLGDVPNQVDFIFHPSFTFGNDRYQQETLTQTIPIVPAQIKLNVGLKSNTLKPGTDASFKIHYEHIGTETLYNIELGIVSDSPFFKKQQTKNPLIKELRPGDEGDVIITVPIRSTVPQSALTNFENIVIPIQPIAEYVLAENKTQRITTVGTDLETNLTTPINFESFARYTTPNGDQIGRGPLPPRVGEKTSYWIFWNVDGTTNTIDHVAIEGTLPDNVTFTGQQTSSEDNGVAFDLETHKIRWNVSSIPPTLNPASKIFGVAFEVTLTPTSQQIGTSPFLIKDVQLTGTDSFTGAFVSASGTNINTNLPTDQKAVKKGVVR